MISSIEGSQKLFPDALSRWVAADERTTFFAMTYKGSDYSEPGFSDTPEHLCCGINVTYGALQMALIMGCDPICLVGVDFTFQPPESAEKSGQEFVHSGGTTHFLSNYRKEGHIFHNL